MPVQQHVLNWLYSVLTSEYHDVNRAYSDVAQALAHYTNLSPRTDVHTFDNGTSALLLHLSGTIPVTFRGATYRFPVSIWVPHAYPKQAPLVYVTPTDSMVVRPGQHVDPQGQVYHPYLVGWSTFWDKSTILDFLAILTDIFAKEPPVVSRQRPPATQAPAPTPPPVPPLPPEMAPRSSGQSQPANIARQEPPPPPPKGPTAEAPERISVEQTLPPVPPHPPSSHLAPNMEPREESGPRLEQPTTGRLSRYETAPPLPQQDPHLRGVYRPSNPPVYTANASLPRPAPQPPQLPQPVNPGPGVMAGPPPQLFSGPPPGWTAQQQPQQPKAKALPPPDLLDEPLTLPMPLPNNVPPPPIPPNPEKDALLHQLARTLFSMRQATRQQHASCMDGLRAQHAAMMSAFSNLHSDAAALSRVSALLTSNGDILRDALHKADKVIEGSRQQKAPNIDELLVAPTVVANQLYSLVAEERVIGDTIFVLGRAVERGRISPAVFAKTTRSLAREWYLKKALVRKIGRGMGLAT